MSAVVGTARRKRRAGPIGRTSLSGRVTSNVVLALFAVYFLLPLWWLVVAATKDNNGLFHSHAMWFASKNSLWQNISELFTRDDGLYLRWVENTALYAVVSGAGATVVAALAGYAFAKLHFRARNAIFSVLLGVLMVPATALVLPTYLMFSKVGLTDTVWSVILPSLLNPFGVYLVRVYAYESVPDELLDAARMDGAGELTTFTRVAMPIMRPALVTVFIFSMVSTWNSFFLPLVMLSNQRLFPLTVGLRSWYQSATIGSGGEALFNLVLVGALLSIIPLVVAFLLLQRFWKAGLTIGGLR